MSLASRWSRRGFITFTAAVAFTTCVTTRGEDSPDPSTPKGVAYAFGQAIEKHDVAGAKALTVGSPDDGRMIDGFAAVADAKAKLHAAAEKKFGKDEVTTGPLAGPAQTAGADRFKKANDYEEKIDGDTATLAPKADAAGNAPAGRPGMAMRGPMAVKPLSFKKLDGKWKLDLAALLPEQNREIFFTMLSAAAKANTEVADGVDAGTYASADAAKAALREKMMTAMRGAFGGANGRPGRPGAGN